jgi:hypothetical protein
LQVDHNFHIVDEFNIVLVDTYHKFHTHCIANDFIFVLVEKDDKFHLYDNQNKLSILFPFPPYFDKVEYGHIQYIVHVSLNSWMSLSVMIVAFRPRLLHLKMLHPMFHCHLKQLKVHHFSRFLPCVMHCIFNPFSLWKQEDYNSL